MVACSATLAGDKPKRGFRWGLARELTAGYAVTIVYETSVKVVPPSSRINSHVRYHTDPRQM